MKQAFKAQGFPRLYAALTTSMFGDSVMLLVLSMWVKTLTGSNAQAGLTFFFMVIPSLFGPLIGVWIDRVRRKPMLVWGNLASAAVILPLLLVSDASHVWLIWVVAFLYGVSFVVLPAALNGLLKEMVPEDLLVDANASLQTTKEALRLFGPLVGAALFAWSGGWAVVMVDALSFVVAGVVIATIRVREEQPEQETSHVLTQMVEGLRHLVAERVLGNVLIGFGLAMLVIGFIEASIYALLDAFDRPATFAGVVVTVQGVGAVLGGLMSSRVIRKVGEVGAAALGLFMLGGSIGFVAVAPSMAFVLAGTIPMGISLPILLVAYMTLLQRRTPQRLMGRVSTAAEVVMSTPQAISLAVGSLLVSMLDYRAIFTIVAVVTALGGAYIVAVLRSVIVADIARSGGAISESAEIADGAGPESVPFVDTPEVAAELDT